MMTETEITEVFRGQVIDVDSMPSRSIPMAKKYERFTGDFRAVTRKRFLSTTANDFVWLGRRLVGISEWACGECSIELSSSLERITDVESFDVFGKTFHHQEVIRLSIKPKDKNLYPAWAVMDFSRHQRDCFTFYAQCEPLAEAVAFAMFDRPDAPPSANWELATGDWRKMERMQGKPQ